MTDTDARKLADAQNPGAGPGEYAKRNLVDPPPRVRDILNAALPTANSPTGDVSPGLREELAMKMVNPYVLQTMETCRAQADWNYYLYIADAIIALLNSKYRIMTREG